MENQDLMIRVQDVKKQYRLGQIGGGTLRGDLQSWWARKRGKEDPNTQIGTDQRLVGTTFMALNGVSFTVNKGEAVGIIGSNGAGKSTLLKLLTHVTAPTSGDIDLYGRVASMLEVGTGFHPEMTGRENVYLNGAILGMTRAEIDAKMDQIIEFSEVGDFIDTPVKRYSSGMYVKLAFSVAAHLDSEIMIMDEVLAVGDMKFQQKCLNKMREEATSRARTILYVSHNMNTIRQLCDRCIVLDKGKVVFEGDVEKAIEIYLGNRANSDCVIDLGSMERAPEFKDHTVTMNSFVADDRKTAVYEVGEQLKGVLTCYSDVDKIAAQLRVIIKTADEVPVTMLTTRKGFDLQKGEKNELSIALDTAQLAPGDYTCSFVIYEVNALGGTVNLDGLKDVYCFKVAAKPGFNNNMPWLNRYWGSVYGNEIEIGQRSVAENG